MGNERKHGVEENDYGRLRKCNEQCKDAMNLTEFLESIQLNLQDLMKIAEDGQTTGMSNILIDKLNSLDVFKRPVHCSDVKKETTYIKDQDIWEKEEENKPKLKNVLDKLIKKRHRC